MSDAIWYYVDRTQQRMGPVTADALVAAWHAGDAADESLVWREGMTDWRPLAEHRAELGLAAAPAPVGALPAYSPPGPLPPAGTPAGKPVPAKSNSGCLIIGIVAVIGLIAIVGIIAAVAVPAYNEYVEKAKAAAEEVAADVESGDIDGDGVADIDDYVDPDGDTGETPFTAGSASVSAALAEGRARQAEVDAFVANTDRCPRDAEELALAEPATPGVRAFAVGVSATRMCTITIEFGGPEAGPLDGEHILLSRDGGGDWYCTSDMADRSQLPSDCY